MPVTLIVGSGEHRGWKQIGISLSMENLSGGFNLTVSEKFPKGSRNIKPGDECSLLIEENTIITGYVDDVNPSFNDRNHDVIFTGRDKSGDLVDCSAINSPGEWSGLKMDRIVEALIKPFGIGLKVETNIGETFPKFNIEQGETVHETISRMAKLRGVLVLSDKDGGLILANRAQTRSADSLISIENNDTNNILAASLVSSHKERYSDIIVKAQTQGSDDQSGDVTRGAQGKFKDATIRHRPLLVIAEGQANAKQAQERALWEGATRFGKSKRVRIGVQGWRQSDGSLWEINTISRVVIPWLELDEDMLIVSLNFRLSGSGTFTELELVRPEAYDTIRGAEKV